MRLFGGRPVGRWAGGRRSGKLSKTSSEDIANTSTRSYQAWDAQIWCFKEATGIQPFSMIDSILNPFEQKLQRHPIRRIQGSLRRSLEAEALSPPGLLSSLFVTQDKHFSEMQPVEIDPTRKTEKTGEDGNQGEKKSVFNLS